MAISKNPLDIALPSSAISEARAAFLSNSRKGDWLNPLNMIVLMKAVREEADHCYFELRSGRTKMLITYPRPDAVYVEVEEGFVPCGMITRERIEQAFKDTNG